MTPSLFVPSIALHDDLIPPPGGLGTDIKTLRSTEHINRTFRLRNLEPKEILLRSALSIVCSYSFAVETHYANITINPTFCGLRREPYQIFSIVISSASI